MKFQLTKKMNTRKDTRFPGREEVTLRDKNASNDRGKETLVKEGIFVDDVNELDNG